ncbi:MAG: dTDP-4-dehydrorhamnose 3,5-epimerase [Candidatus Gastranaerophilales bacterium]|nr:dTDP-4-dehydrorhamnose 3,5-epimerase [Candidatus Gastranaerophilales bacterium]
MPFEFENTKIKDVVLVKPQVFNDDRGFFLEMYKKEDFSAFGIKDDFNQDNRSKSSFGVLRGLHYQKNPNAQAKLVSCVKGKILDVAVDIRKNSPTFLKWVKYELNEENKYMLYLPQGFAHGFIALSDWAEVIYKVSGRYSPKDEMTIAWNDKDIKIDWELNFEPILSNKDKKALQISETSEEDLL